MAMVLALGALVLVMASAARWFRAAMAVQLPADRSGYVAAWLGGALLGAAALASGPGWGAGSAAALAVLGGGFLCLTVAISPQRVAADAVRVGERLRDFRALDENGEPFALSSLAGKPLLLKFFRGHW